VDATQSNAPAHETTNPSTRAGDPFAYAGERQECPRCFGGYLTITVEENGQERDEAVPCRRCHTNEGVEMD
jgi:hypothetical protein